MSEMDKYDMVGDFIEGLAIVIKDYPLPEEKRTDEVDFYSTFGFIDESGREVTPCKYEDANPFHEGMALVKLGGKYGFVDKTGKEVVPCQYRYARDYHDGLANVEGNVFIDKTGKEVLHLKDIVPFDFSEGLAAVVRVGGKRGYIDKTGQVVIPCQYDEANVFHDGLALVALGERRFFIDMTGREVMEFVPEPADADDDIPF